MILGSYSRAGRRHIEEGRENQDYIMSDDSPRYCAIVLSDGATGCSRGGEGAVLACRAVIQIVRQEGSGFFSGPEKKIAFLLREHILYFIEKNEHTEDISEYGSTLSFALLDKATKKCVMANIGDSAVMSVKDGKVRCLLEPRKFGAKTVLTTTQDADRALAVKTVQLEEGENIFLASDGFLYELSNGKVLDALSRGRLDLLREQLQEADLPDDCSYIAAG